jgi:hypothetical protein
MGFERLEIALEVVELSGRSNEPKRVDDDEGEFSLFR